MANLPIEINTPSRHHFHDDAPFRTSSLVSSFHSTARRTPLSNLPRQKLESVQSLTRLYKPSNNNNTQSVRSLPNPHKAAIMQKRYQIERERALIDLELRRLELEEQKSRCMFGELHLNDKPQRRETAHATVATSTLRMGHPPLGKMLTASRLSKRTWDSSSNTKDMSLSSSNSTSSSSSSEDEEEKRRLLQAKQQRREDAISIKEIVVQYSTHSQDGDGEDNNSVTSLLTLQLSPWEELEQFIQAEQKDAIETARRMGPPKPQGLQCDKMECDKMETGPRKSSKKQSPDQRKKQGRHHRHGSHKRANPSPPPPAPRQDSFRTNLDEGDEHPGRVKNMSLQIDFPLNYIDNHFYFSPQWLHSSPSVHATYTGPLRQGLPYGIAILRFDNGDMYMGEVVWGEMHGQGTYRTKRGQVWRGMFEHNVFVGEDAAVAAVTNTSALAT